MKLLNMVPCPYCGENISENFKLCPYCGEPLNYDLDNVTQYDDDYDSNEDDRYYADINGYSSYDDRKISMVWTLPVALISQTLCILTIALGGGLAAVIVFTVISFITLFFSGLTTNSKFRAWGVSLAALLISIMNVLMGLFVILLTLFGL